MRGVKRDMKFEDSDASLESLLRSLPLREPGEQLDARVAAALAQARFRHARRFRFYPMALAAGLLIALGIGIHLATFKKSPPPVVASIPQPGPIQIERDTSTLYDEGIIADSDDAAYQKFRRRTVREIWYINPATHARALMTIPTEQIVIQKVDSF
jgi:hypothetical protein